MTFTHEPVLLAETLELLAPRPGDTVVDCTLGGGGHTRALWQAMEHQGRLIAIDQDSRAIAWNKQILPPEISLVQDNFRNLISIMAGLSISHVDRFLFDLGVSSPQLDEAERGFSYQQDAPLDMRMDQKHPTTAAELINELSQAELTRLFWEYGEERWAARIAEFIVDHRSQGTEIRTTGQLVSIIKEAIPRGARQEGPHPAKRTFQALRIAVNDELGALDAALQAAIQLLAPGGRLAVITFHSLEDRIVKHAFKEAERGCICPPRLPVCVCGRVPTLRIITGRPVTPGSRETDHNPRARSAKLRVAERLPGSKDEKR